MIALLVALTALQQNMVEDYIKEQMQGRHIPGLAYAVLRDGKVVSEGVYGMADLENDVKIKPESVFLLASISKSFTGTAISILNEEKKLNLDDPIDKYIENVPETWKQITIRHLLHHTAGLKDRFELTSDNRMFMDWTKAQMLDAAKKTPVDFKPGERWQYSDQGYFLLGLIIEKASGSSYRQFVTDRIFKPLGMDTATFHNHGQIVKNRVHGYSLFGTLNIASERRYGFEMVSHYGVMASLRDMAKFEAGLVDGKILSSAAQQSSWEPGKLASGATTLAGIGSYGHGWFVEPYLGHQLVYHAGSTGPGFFRIPDLKLAVVVLINLEQIAGGNGMAIAQGIAKVFEPSLDYKKLEPATDPKPDQAAAMKKEIENMAAGTANESMYVPESYALLKPSIAAQKAAFSQFGKLKEFVFLAEDSLGTSRIATYKAAYEKITIYYRIRLNADGKIETLAGEAG